MQFLQNILQNTLTKAIMRSISRVMIGGFAALIGFSFVLTGSAYAGETYVTPDGTDITAIAECIPPELTEGNLDRALRESGNDFLEKVFNTESSYKDYDLEASEIEYLECLKRNGVTPEVKKIES